MFALVLGVLRARTAQTATVLLLTVLASVAATASPWYLLASARRAAAAEVDAAPAAKRMLSVRGITGTAGDPQAALTNFGDSVKRMLPVPGPNPVLGVTRSLSAIQALTTHSMSMAYRDGFCTHMQLVGSCATAPGEAVISSYSAAGLRLDVGDLLTLGACPTSAPTALPP